MRLLLTTDTIGGVWTYTKELAEALLERSHAVALVSFARPPSTGQAAWFSAMSKRYGEAFLYIASEVPLEWMEANEDAYSRAEGLLLKLAHDFRADLLHSNQFCFGRLPTRIPRLVVAHSDVLSWAAACQPDGLARSPWLDRYIDLVQAGLASAQAVVAPTGWMLRALGEHFPLPHEVRVIPNGRQIDAAPVPLHRSLQAVTIGRMWDLAKGISILERVHANLPIFVVGESRHGNAIASMSIGPAAFLGPMEEQPLLTLLRSSSIYLALSIYEPFGLAPLEAALCGCAIVANDIPSFREVWGADALYFKDERSLSDLLSQLCSEPDLLRNFQERARTRALDRSRSCMVEQYLDLYHHLIDPAHPLTPQNSSGEVAAHVS